MKPTVAIVNYGLGNVRSISNAINKVGGKVLLTNQESEILSADALILPGVGAFSVAMKNLKALQLDKTILNYIRTGKPVLGICLGMQILMQAGKEHENTDGLGVLEGEVIKIPLPETSSLRLPHIGWNTLEPIAPECWKNSLLSETNPNHYFYFVHSYVVCPRDPSIILAKTKFGEDCEFVSAIHQKNLFGVQFHPEKSGSAGLRILENFVKRCC